MELLQCTGMKIGEITELCGYKDQYYFSHCFKKADWSITEQIQEGT